MAEHVGLLCPVCRTDLVMADRSGVEIDYCPKCRGVWLDRGELDKIIDRTAPEAPPPPSGYDRGYDKDREYRGQGRYEDQYRGRKKKSLLGEIFDF
ncbi:zf-TFIIB domain-containing protein [Chelativorans sp.]|uniref:TFIIB-type zinc ribbon-containing protein n=1 Tax=Chelativorans sp. TaxID=2203393 RepID=UPI002811A1E9|nr:zf-TFIIB domain-containing protein [Chelativorans sp.]